MATMNISLPARMKKFVDEQVATGGFSSASEYVRDLVREARKEIEDERLEQLLLDGLNSGPDKPMTKKDWDNIRSDLKRHIARRRKQKMRK